MACHSNVKSTQTVRTKPTTVNKTAKQPPNIPTPEKPVLNPTVAGIAWYESEYFMPVLEEAKKQGKMVFLTFHASWCAPCKVMEEEVFSQKSVAEYLNAHFLSYRADFDAPNGKRMAEIFGVNTLPTSLFVNAQGVALQRKTGMLTISDVFKLGDAARK